jgi:heme-degrading monooxygenase HmoA
MKAGSAEWGYVIVWEFQVRQGVENEFEQVYGGQGAWAEFFRQADGYLGTELNKDFKCPGRYLTLDFWRSRAEYERFREEYGPEYKALDVRCERLTKSEKETGCFERVKS